MRTRNHKSQSAALPPSSPATAPPPSRKRLRKDPAEETAAYGTLLTSNDHSNIYALPVESAKEVTAAHLKQNTIGALELRKTLRKAQCTHLLASFLKNHTFGTPEEAGSNASALLMLSGEQLTAIHVVSTHRQDSFGTNILLQAKKLQRNLLVSAPPCGTSTCTRTLECASC